MPPTAPLVSEPSEATVNEWPFMSIGATKISDPKQIVMTLDHDVQNKTEKNLKVFKDYLWWEGPTNHSSPQAVHAFEKILFGTDEPAPEPLPFG